MPKDDKQYKCTIPGCDWPGGKTQGALTAHIKKHGKDDPVAAVRASIPGAPRPGGIFTEHRPLVASPSGIPSIDYAIGIGGVPRGTIMEIFGPAASGKTLTALAFSRHAIYNGGKAGFMDAENALQESFVRLADYGEERLAAELEYGPTPNIEGDDYWDGSGEAALEASRRFINTKEFDVWTVDSVAACTPRSVIGKPINDPVTRAALAQLMRSALAVLEHEIARTNTLGVFVNHVTTIPGVTYGRDWSKPAGSAFDYYSSVQLRVWASKIYYNAENRRIGHRVKVKVEKSKVSAPHATATYDLYYAADVPTTKECPRQGQLVEPGVDLPTCWVSVLKESNKLIYAGNKWIDAQHGTVYGTAAEVLEQLEDPGSELLAEARKLVYPEAYAPAMA